MVSGKKQTILIVDDTQENILLLSEVLESDYLTKAAIDGERALKIASAAEPPDLVLLDVMMPGMDGYEVCKRLKTNPGTRHIPVIFVTAMNEVEDETKGLDLGAVDYITKPISPPIVKARVKAHLERYEQKRELERMVVKLEEQAHELAAWNQTLEQRVAEGVAQAAAAHARINHLLTSSPAVLYSFEATENNNPTFVSDNLRDVLGYEPREYLEDRKFVPDRIHPDDAARYRGNLSRLFKEGYMINEYRFRRKDGGYCWVSDELKVIHNDAGKPVEVVGSWSEITKRKLAEEALDRLARMKRFFSPAVADLILSGNADDPLKTHRREIVVVFLDLREFTTFSESADPEEVMSVLAEYHAAMGELIMKYAGTLERFAGDGIMIFFNDPVLIPNPAAQAVSMALEMQQRFKGLAAAWARRGYDLSLGIGIAQGFATIGAIGFEGRRDYGAIGNVTNLAARLCSEANGGQILVSQRVEAALGEVAKSQPIGEISLKGFSKPIKTFEIRWNI